jgi:hypothetical protein
MRAKRFIYYLQFLLQSCCRFSERTHFIWANGLSPKPICAVNLGVLSQNLASRGTQSRSIAGITAFAGKVDGKEYPDGDKCPDITSVTVTAPLEWGSMREVVEAGSTWCQNSV